MGPPDKCCPYCDGEDIKVIPPYPKSILIWYECKTCKRIWSLQKK
jgi:hypothetical protein